jgi:osmotically inducible protein OsmC
MPVRSANAEWNGSLKEGAGRIRFESGAFDGKYSFGTRFEDAPGTNPEELIAAAHAGCFSMALSAGMGKAGFSPSSIRTKASVKFEKVGEGFAITRIDLDCEAEIPGIDDATFQEQAEGAKKNCPISKALAAVETINLNARLKS